MVGGAGWEGGGSRGWGKVKGWSCDTADVLVLLRALSTGFTIFTENTNIL